MRVLSFDIGIKNLAYCLLQFSPASSSLKSANWEILDWGIWDLRINFNEQSKYPEVCNCKTNSGKSCSRKPIYYEIISGEIINGLCKTHASKTQCKYHMNDLLSIKKMKIKELRDYCNENNIDHNGKIKSEILSIINDTITNNCLMKIPSMKKAKQIPLGTLHERLLERIEDHHLQCDLILIENQPVRLNAVMKSVQMILWTSLRTLMLQKGITKPNIYFINADKKLLVQPNQNIVSRFEIFKSNNEKDPI